MAKMALEGIRIADWTRGAAGPSATMWLATFGAEVFKIETRDGSGTRQELRPGRLQWGVQTSGSKVKGLFEVLNHNKKSIAVDLKKDEGKEIIYRLVETADVFAHNQLPDTVEKLGMDYETLRKYNPRLIYGVASVFGSKGPRRLVPAADTYGQAISGLMTTCGSRGDPLTWATPGISDFASGFSLASAIFLALLHRERTGEGQIVEGTQLQAGMNIYNLAMLATYLFLPEEQRLEDPHYNGGNFTEWRWERRGGLSQGTTYVKCKDDRWVMIGFSNDKNWKAFCEAIGQPELASDPKFSTQEQRLDNWEEIFPLVDQIFASKTLAEWEEAFRGKDCGFAPILRMRELPNEPQVIANDYLYTFDHPVVGRVQYPVAPFTMSKTPASVMAPAPGLGEHSDEILLELGYSPEEVLQLHEKEVVK